METTRVLLGGATITIATLALVGLVRAVAPAAVANPRRLLTDRTYLSDHLWLVGASVALFLAISLTLAALWFALMPMSGLTGKVSPESAWVAVFNRLPRRIDVDRNLVTQLQVNLIDGRAYIGIRDAYSADHTLENRELVLAAPLQARANGEGFAPLDPGWQRVIIPASQIQSIHVRFAMPAASPSTVRRRPARAIADRLRRTAFRPRILLALLVAEVVAPMAIGHAFGGR